MNIETLSVYRILTDCNRAYELLEQVTDDEQLFRIYWLMCLALLRTVEDVIEKVDAVDYPAIGKQWIIRKEQLKKLSREFSDKPFVD